MASCAESSSPGTQRDVIACVCLQALHYKELEYQGSPLTAAESLIHICNQLRLPDAAQGILRHTMKVAPGAEQKIGANWYEKLRMYDTALSLYRKKLQARNPPNPPVCALTKTPSSSSICYRQGRCGSLRKHAS